MSDNPETNDAAASPAERCVMLRNSNGVEILEKSKGEHYQAHNARCNCGEILMVAPKAFHPDHKKGDPVMICGDHGAHGYRFTDLIVGIQAT